MMVRVRLLSGSHWQDGQKYEAGDEFDATNDVYRTFKYRLEKLPDDAGREPLIEEETEPDDGADAWVLEDAWADADATDAAMELAVENGVWPEDVEGTGLGGRVLVGDVREHLG